MHRCAAKCCDDRSMSMESVQNCMTQCSAKLTPAQKSIEEEMKNFQVKILFERYLLAFYVEIFL